MIFVTVGTHEQPFNRLIECVDNLKKVGIIQEEVIMQIGYSTYKPKYCKWKKIMPYCQMVENVSKARIVITHGGPASFIMPLQNGKIPIVVPRQEKFHEHVNNHQLEFSKMVFERYKNIMIVDDISELQELLLNYDFLAMKMSSGLSSNNSKFNKEFEKQVSKLF